MEAPSINGKALYKVIQMVGPYIMGVGPYISR